MQIVRQAKSISFLFYFQWDTRQAHVRWSRMTDDSTEETKSTTLIDVTPEQSFSSLQSNPSSSLRRLLIEQSVSDDSELEDDEDEDYNPLDL